MDKKVLKWYESPVMEVVDVEVESQILAGSGNAEGVEEETPDPETDFELD